MAKKPDAAAALAAQLIDVLEAQRAPGAGNSPLTLRRLAELCGRSADPDLVLKAVSKKAFTARTVVTEKVNRKPTLDSPVYLKGDEPAKPKRAPAARKPSGGATVEELAARLLSVLEAQRRLGADAYPPTLRRLAELCERKASDTLVPKAAAHAVVTDRALVVGKPVLDAPILFKDDIEHGMASVVPVLLRLALRPTTVTVKKKKVETHAFSPAELGKKFVPPLQQAIGAAVQRAVEQNELPPEVAWVEIKGEPHLFLLKNLRPTGTRPTPPVAALTDGPTVTSVQPAATPSRDFAEAFREVFDRLDRRNGATNFVKLSDLRRELSEFRRDAFDAGLDRLRRDWRYSLSSHEGLNVSLSSEDREAGVNEAGSLLVYASRR